MSSQHVQALLNKSAHYDKDERYMATSDLCEVLKKHASNDTSVAPLSPSVEKDICKTVLNLLHDQSNDVQAVAVKTLGVLLTTVQQAQVLEIADSLTDQVLDANKGELRDVYAIGLRTLVKTCPKSMGPHVSQRLLGRLLEGIRNGTEEIILACLDVLIDLLSRFGAGPVSELHEPVLQMCLAQLKSNTPVIRKRAGNTLACLSTVLHDTLLQRMVDSLLETDTDTTSLMRTLCSISGAVGHRLGALQIDRMVPLFLQYTKPEEAVTGDDEDWESTVSIELRESCFMGFESLAARCPGEMERHLSTISSATLAYMSYDPNYSYGEEEEEQEEPDEEMEDYDEEEYEDEDDDEFGDEDDDESWKVRRSAIRVLRAIVESKQHDPMMLWTTTYPVRQGKSLPVARALVQRFKEREENCRVGIIDCFNRLVEVTVAAQLATADAMSDTTTVDMQEYAPSIVKSCKTILAVKKGNERSKSSALALLSTLSKAPGGVGQESDIADVFAHVQKFLSVSEDAERDGTSKALRLDALSLVLAMLESNAYEPSHVRTSLTTLLPELCRAVQEKWYKVIAEALRALAAVPPFYVQASAAEKQDVCQKIVVAVEPLLAAHDVDQEIKECALKVCASLLSHLHTSLPPEHSGRLLELLLERLKNENTRIAAIKTIHTIAKSQSGGDLSSIMVETINTMASFLCLQSRSLKQSSLEALNAVVMNHGSSAVFTDGTVYSGVLSQLAALISDRDLHLSHLSLEVSVSILRVCPAAGPAYETHLVEPALQLSTSSILQDSALDSLLALFQQVVVSKAMAFDPLLQLLQQRLTEGISKRGVYNLAKCIAMIAGPSGEASIKKLLGDVKRVLEGSKTPTDDAQLRTVQLSLLITGDLGRTMDLNQYDGIGDSLKTIYLGYFESVSDDIKNAASYALGNVTVGSPSFLQTIVSKLDEDNKKQQYLLLSALREYIQCAAKKDSSSLSTSMATIVPPLERHCSDGEEAVRTMVAECLGSLVCSNPEEMLKKLSEMHQQHTHIVVKEDGVADETDETSKNNSNICWTVASAIKLAIAGKVDTAALSKHMPSFMAMMSSNDIHVRHAALLMVYAATHHMPQAVAPLIQETVLPSLFEISKLKMQRKVDLGPFTHTVDDALPLRKATLSIFATLLEKLPSSLDISEFVSVLAVSLGDAEDIQLHAHQIVISMCAKQPAYIVAAAEKFVEPLEKTMNKKAGTKTGTELDRLNDWIKSALRVMLAVGNLDGSMSIQKYSDFVERVKANDKFKSKLEALDEEN